jgi:hypothetical protein
MTAGSNDEYGGADDMNNKTGIVASHAYSLLGAYEIVTDYSGRKKVKR